MQLVNETAKVQECVDRTITWLHQVWLLTEQGRPLQPDPFYPRNDLLTSEVVKQVIEGIEGVFISELTKFPEYHRKAQGISASERLVPPGFPQLPYSEQLAVVQGIDRIFQDYRAPESGPRAQPQPHHV